MGKRIDKIKHWFREPVSQKTILAIRGTSGYAIMFWYGVAMLILFVSLLTSFVYFKVPSILQATWISALAEGFGFIGLSLVELTIFLWVVKPKKLEGLGLKSVA